MDGKQMKILPQAMNMHDASEVGFLMRREQAQTMCHPDRLVLQACKVDTCF
jgi:hypothetical protein